MDRGDIVTVSHSSQVMVEECCTCGVLFLISKTYQKRLSDNPKDFYCPNGHPQRYSNPLTQKLDLLTFNLEISQSENKKLKSELAELKKSKVLREELVFIRKEFETLKRIQSIKMFTIELLAEKKFCQIQ
jgi:hypothetical protein